MIGTFREGEVLASVDGVTDAKLLHVYVLHHTLRHLLIDQCEWSTLDS